MICICLGDANNINYQFDPTNFTKLTKFKNFDIDCPSSNLTDLVWSNIVCPGKCYKCGRESTTYYPLELTQINSETLNSDKLGLRLKNISYVVSCERCVEDL